MTLSDILRWGLGILAAAVLVLLLCRNSILAWLRSRNKPVVTEWATLEKRNYQTGGNGALAAFHLESEPNPKKLLIVECGDNFVARLPELGTRGKLTHKGQILYSFQWPGETLILNEPPKEGVRDDTFGMLF